MTKLIVALRNFANNLHIDLLVFKYLQNRVCSILVYIFFVHQV